MIQMFVIYVVSLYFWLLIWISILVSQTSYSDESKNWDMTFSFVYLKIVSCILLHASCIDFLVPFRFIMSWRVGFSFQRFTASITNPFMLQFFQRILLERMFVVPFVLCSSIGHLNLVTQWTHLIAFLSFRGCCPMAKCLTSSNA